MGSNSSCPDVRIDIPDMHDPHIDALLRPRLKQEGTLRCRVRRVDRHRLELHIETGYIFVLAAVRFGRDWLIMDRQQSSAGDGITGGSGANGGKGGHIARLRSHKDSTFTCVRSRYEQPTMTEGHARELLFIRHSTKQMTDDLPALNVMQVGTLPCPVPFRRHSAPARPLGHGDSAIRGRFV